jgi:hypothetical protein
VKGEVARAAKERAVAAREEAQRRGCGRAARLRRSTAARLRRSTVAREEVRRRWRRKRRRPKKVDRDVRLKRLRSAFHAMIGRAGRLTGRGGAASSQSPVSS